DDHRISSVVSSTVAGRGTPDGEPNDSNRAAAHRTATSRPSRNCRSPPLQLTVESEEPTAERGEFGRRGRLRIDLTLPPTPPRRSALSSPAFDAILAIGLRTLGMHRDRLRESRPRAAVPAAVVRQAGAPDHEIPHPHLNLNHIIAGKIDRSVEHGPPM